MNVAKDRKRPDGHGTVIIIRIGDHRGVSNLMGIYRLFIAVRRWYYVMSLFYPFTVIIFITAEIILRLTWTVFSGSPILHRYVRIDVFVKWRLWQIKDNK